LHGNETTGFYALQKYLAKYKNDLPMNLMIFFGNIPAAKAGVRKIEGEKDFNRIWGGGEYDEARMARKIFKLARERAIVANIDIHNNTGKNPYYACVNFTDEEFLSFGRQFNDTIIYFTEPHEVQSNAFAQICPSLTIEAGLPGVPEGIDYVASFLEKVTTDFDFKNPPKYDDYLIYHTIGRIKLPYYSTIDFDYNEDSPHDFSFLSDFDGYNFQLVPKGTVLGYLKKDSVQLAVIDNHDRLVTEKYFAFEGKKILAASDLIPSMFTKIVKVAKDDSLGYLMEVYPWN
jgi:succinylglutamate desuccinylase